MRLGTLLLRLLVVLLIAAGIGQWWLLREAEYRAQRFIAQWQGYGELRYERLWVWPWGSACVWNLSFRPTGFTQAMLGTPLDYRIEVRELRIRGLGLADDGSLERVRLQFGGLRFPVVQGGDRGPKTPIGFGEMGYRALQLDLALRLQLVPDAGLILAEGNAAGVDLARLHFKAEIESDPRRLRNAPDQTGLRRLTLEYADDGLMPRYKQAVAARLRLSPAAAEQAIMGDLRMRAQRYRWRWDTDSAQALLGFVRDPSYGRVELDPPGEVILRNLRLYAVDDWPQLLGFRFSTDGSFRHPKPADGP